MGEKCKEHTKPYTIVIDRFSFQFSSKQHFRGHFWWIFFSWWEGGGGRWNLRMVTVWHPSATSRRATQALFHVWCEVEWGLAKAKDSVSKVVELPQNTLSSFLERRANCISKLNSKGKHFPFLQTHLVWFGPRLEKGRAEDPNSVCQGFAEQVKKDADGHGVTWRRPITKSKHGC